MYVLDWIVLSLLTLRYHTGKNSGKGQFYLTCLPSLFFGSISKQQLSTAVVLALTFSYCPHFFYLVSYPHFQDFVSNCPHFSVLVLIALTFKNLVQTALTFKKLVHAALTFRFWFL